MKFLGGMKICGYFGGSSQSWTIFMGQFYVFNLFLRSMYKMGDILGGC